jgi:hypothetical protein
MMEQVVKKKRQTTMSAVPLFSDMRTYTALVACGRLRKQRVGSAMMTATREYYLGTTGQELDVSTYENLYGAIDMLVKEKKYKSISDFVEKACQEYCNKVVKQYTFETIPAVPVNKGFGFK